MTPAVIYEKDVNGKMSILRLRQDGDEEAVAGQVPQEKRIRP
jgi:hypothetical protein